MHSPGDFFLILRVSGKRYKVFDSERAVIFIDGNNFYHAVSRLGLSSLDMDYARFSDKLVEGRKRVETRYYIGKVRQEGDLTRALKQQNFISSLNKFDRVCHYYGRVESRPAKDASKRLTKWLDTLAKREDICIADNAVAELRNIAAKKQFQYVEKAVDVMIATDMVSMAYEKRYDVAYLLSGDGDFTPAVKKVREIGRKVFVASASHAHKLSQVADAFIPLNREFFHGCRE